MGVGRADENSGSMMKLDVPGHPAKIPEVNEPRASRSAFTQDFSVRFKARMRRKAFLLLFILLHLTPAAAQQPKIKVWRIGFLSGASLSSTRDRIAAFNEALRTLGYVNGRNISIEWKFAEGRFDLLPGLAADLVRLKPDVIVIAGGEPVTAAAKRATQTIPIVMANAFDPLSSGLVASLARPGGNITGFTTTPGPEIHGK